MYASSDLYNNHMIFYRYDMWLTLGQLRNPRETSRAEELARGSTSAGVESTFGT